MLSILFLNKLLFTNQTLAAQDFNNIQITFNSFFGESFRNYLTPPLWFTKIGGGIDMFSNPISSYFSPFNIIFVLVSNVYFATNLFVLFQVCFLATTSYLLFREFNLSKQLSFFGAIAFTFNGFLVMRLSPGVGIEYLYTYKWIPLILIFSNRVLKENKFEQIFYLGTCLGFTFEGNPSIAFGTWLFWFTYILVIKGKNILNSVKQLLIAAVFGILFFAIKILPGVDMMFSSSGRISNSIEGWRTSRIKLYDFLDYLLPIAHKFLTPIFTPGILVIILFVFGLGFLIKNIYKSRKITSIDLFSVVSFLIGFILNTDNQLSEILYTLPIFNRFTVTPSYLSFIIFPTIYFSICGLKNLTEFFRLKLGIFITLGISLLVFCEILAGPASFGSKSFGFNFAKMDTTEVFSYPHYVVLKEFPNEFYYFNSNNSVFMYPYAIQLNNSHTLNSYKYFYEGFDSAKLDSKNLDFNKKFADIIIDVEPLSNPDLMLIKTIDMNKFIDLNFKSQAVQDKKYQFFDIFTHYNWDGKFYLYKVDSSVSSIKNVSNNPYSFTFNISSKNLENEKLLTSISYSKWWVISNQKNIKLNFEKNSFGLIEVKNVSNGDNLNFLYFNPYIYLGMLFSLICFAILIIVSFSKK